MEGLKINVDHAAIADLNATTARFISEFGKDEHEAVKMEAIYLLRSIRARTSQSKPRRKVTRAEKFGRPKWCTPARGQYAGKKCRVFQVVSFPKGNMKVQNFYAPTLHDAKASKFALIGRAGLAKASFGWLAHKIFGSGLSGKDGQLHIPEGVLSATRTNDNASLRFTMRLENALDYIVKATPESALAEAVAAADRALNMKIERLIAARAKAEALS